jgi:hypothetical protein
LDKIGKFKNIQKWWTLLTHTSANISFIFATPSHVSICLVVLNTSSPFHEQKYKSNLNGHFSKEVQIEIKSKTMKTLFFW